MINFFDKPVVGIDVSADFSWVAILAPNGELSRKAFKIKHDADGFLYLSAQIKKAEEEYNMKTAIFMESTGVYHLSLFHFLNTKFDNTFVINPLVTNCNKNSGIRKVKNDKSDALSIAKLGKYQNPKTSKDMDLNNFLLKSLEREYYKLKDTASNFKKKLSADLKIIFPSYNQVFSNPTGKTSLFLLEKYPTPQAILSAPKNELLDLLSSSSKKGLSWASKIFDKLIKYANEALIIGVPIPDLSIKISSSIILINTINLQIDHLLNSMENLIDKDSNLKNSLKILESIPGVGRITSITLIAEIGDIHSFQKAKKLVAFFGLDCSVNQSGKFNSTNNKISKRGTRTGRRALYAVALASIRKNRSGTYINEVLYKYYSETLKGKKPKVALIAIMHKLLNYIFAILTTNKAFEIRNPDLHKQMYLENKFSKSSAA